MTDPLDLLKKTTENLDISGAKRTRASNLPLDSSVETFMGASIGTQSTPINLEAASNLVDSTALSGRTRVRRPRKEAGIIEPIREEVKLPSAPLPEPTIVPPIHPEPVLHAAPTVAEVAPQHSSIPTPSMPPVVPMNTSLPPADILPTPPPPVQISPSPSPSPSPPSEEIMAPLEPSESQTNIVLLLQDELEKWKLSSNQQSPSALQSFLSSQSTRLDSLEERVADLQEDLQAARNQIATLQSSIASKESLIKEKEDIIKEITSNPEGAAAGGADAAEAAIIEMAERELKMMEDLIKEQEAYISELERDMGGQEALASTEEKVLPTPE